MTASLTTDRSRSPGRMLWRAVGLDTGLGDQRQTRLARSVVSVLSVIVVIDYADRNALGAVAPSLRTDLHLDLVQLGYLGAGGGLVGGIATLGAGVLIDRLPRLRLLAGSALLWAVAMLATGAAQSLLWLLLARSALSVVLATVGPAYPSLVGDTVPPAARGRALGVIDSGQLVGVGVGVGVGAVAVALGSWRYAFWSLAIPALVLAYVLARLPEPRRRGSGDARNASLREVAAQLWRIPTAVRVVVATAVGSYYLAGASSFSVLFAVARYHVSTPVADLALLALGVGALAGVIAGSRISDRLSAEHHASRRLDRAAQGYVLTAVFWLPALIVHSLLLALPFLIIGSAALAATIPTLDAVRLDVVPPAIRGRAEAVRTLARALAEGGAPLVFGAVAALAGGGDDHGLQVAFLVTLPGLVATGALLLLAGRSFDGDRQRVLDANADDAG